jgi:hypothetical protein
MYKWVESQAGVFDLDFQVRKNSIYFSINKKIPAPYNKKNGAV